MIKILLSLILTVMLCLQVIAQVSIASDESPPDNSAMLDVKSSDKGILIPSMTNIQILAISEPANGLLVYSTDDNQFYFFHSGDSLWKALSFGTKVPVPVVTNPITGRTWMDRNLGAEQVATSSTDTLAYGYLFQWGRLADNHQERNSDTIRTLSDSDVPGHDDFILVTPSPGDWRSPQNDTLWQIDEGINNPCPVGFRIPTQSEWSAEYNTWPYLNSAGAYSSVLKLPVAGYRDRNNGNIVLAGSYGFYWASTTIGTSSIAIYFFSSNGAASFYNRAGGFSVRCIRDE